MFDDVAAEEGIDPETEIKDQKWGLTEIVIALVIVDHWYCVL